ncbi:MAG: helix-turn-helix transcriptional regulator [Lachnospiraceae bacterium]|nr:helix-turn-helix transcriptional regulator [Lachnospiraceae bacterium]
MGSRLDLLIQIAHSLAVQFGKNCEIVIHDLTKQKLEHSAVYVENGHVSGRKIGDGPSGEVMEAISSRQGDPLPDRLAYRLKTEDGRVLKCSTVFLHGEGGQVDYIFCLNYDITVLQKADRVIQSMLFEQAKAEFPGDEREPEQTACNVNELLDSLIRQALVLVGKPVEAMNKEDKVRVVRFLDEAGAFLITKSGDKVANLLDISKFTLYNYMDGGKKERKSENPEEA